MKRPGTESANLATQGQEKQGSRQEAQGAKVVLLALELSYRGAIPATATNERRKRIGLDAGAAGKQGYLVLL